MTTLLEPHVEVRALREEVLRLKHARDCALYQVKQLREALEWTSSAPETLTSVEHELLAVAAIADQKGFRGAADFIRANLIG